MGKTTHHPTLLILPLAGFAFANGATYLSASDAEFRLLP